MLTITQHFSQQLKRDLIIETLKNLPVLTGNLGAGQNVQDLVTAVVNDTPEEAVRGFSLNNNLGELVGRFIEMSDDSVTDLDERYRQGKANDREYFEGAIHTLAYQLAAVVNNKLFTLQSVIPAENTELINDIGRIVDALGNDPATRRSILVVDWGQLADPQYVMRARTLAQEHASIYVTGGQTHTYYIDAAIAAARRLTGKIKTIEVPADELKLTDLAEKLGVFGEDERLVLGALTDVERAGFLVNSVSASLEQPQAIMLSTATLTVALKICRAIYDSRADLHPDLVANADALEPVVHMLYVAIHAVRETLYHDTLVLAETDHELMVDRANYTKFTKDGGADADIVAFCDWNDLNGFIFPKSGWSGERIISMRERVMDDLVQSRLNNKQKADEQQRLQLVEATRRVLLGWLDGFMKSEVGSHEGKTNDTFIDIALNKISQDGASPHDVLTDFLVAVRCDALLSRLYDAVRAEAGKLSGEIEESMKAVVLTTTVAKFIIALTDRWTE